MLLKNNCPITQVLRAWANQWNSSNSIVKNVKYKNCLKKIVSSSADNSEASAANSFLLTSSPFVLSVARGSLFILVRNPCGGNLWVSANGGVSVGEAGFVYSLTRITGRGGTCTHSPTPQRPSISANGGTSISLRSKKTNIGERSVFLLSFLSGLRPACRAVASLEPLICTHPGY